MKKSTSQKYKENNTDNLRVHRILENDWKTNPKFPYELRLGAWELLTNECILGGKTCNPTCLFLTAIKLWVTIIGSNIYNIKIWIILLAPEGVTLLLVLFIKIKSLYFFQVCGWMLIITFNPVFFTFVITMLFIFNFGSVHAFVNNNITSFILALKW